MTKTSLWLLLLVLGDSKLPLELWQVIFLPIGDGASPWELALGVIISNLEITVVAVKTVTSIKLVVVTKHAMNSSFKATTLFQ